MVLLGLDHTAVPADVPEDALPGENPTTTVVRLALDKALAIPAAYPGSWIVGADTLVALDDEVLGKPAGPEEATAMLERLRAKPHLVTSGVAVLNRAAGQGAVDVARSPVWMRSYSDGEIAAYVETGDPLDKAGAYAIQHPGFHPVDRVEGCHASVVGFPLCHLARTARMLGIPFEADTPSLCWQHTGLPCQVHAQILAGVPHRIFPLPTGEGE
jgi:MAF protein